MTHGHLSFHFAYCFEDYADNDEECGAAERNYVKKAAGRHVEEKRETSDDREEERAHQDDLIEDLLDIDGGGSAGTDAGDRTAVAHKVIRYFNGVEGDRNVEVSKCNDKSEEEYNVYKAQRALCGREELVDNAFLARTCELHDRRGKRDDGARKDDGHYAGHIELDRKIGALTAVLLSADSALRVLNGDSSLSVRHIGYEYERANDDGDDRNPKDDLKPYGNHFAVVDEGTVCCGIEVLTELNEHGGETRNDVRKEDHGDTVADTLFVDSFAEPHNEASAGCVARDDNEHGEPFSKAFGVSNETAVNAGHCLGTENCIVTVSGDQSDTDGYVTSDFFDFLSAFFTVLGKLFKRGDRNAEQLHDDRSVDVRCYGQSKQCCRRERITRKDIQVREDTRAEHICLLLKQVIFDKGNGKSCAYAV